MRLIDADAIVLQKGFFEKVTNVPKFYDWLDTQPTIDAVEVVRCKDCKHSDKIIFPEKPEMLICWSDEQSDRMVCANGYCDMGERREDG